MKVHTAIAAAIAAAVVIIAASGGSTAASEAVAQSGSGWQLPADADTKKSPLEADAKVIASGRAVYKSKCAKCHGPGGLGDGPDADPEHRENMDLTNPKRADRNSDGVVFYKVWNGRRRPKMPTFSEELNETQVWSVVAYVQTLRKK